MKIAVVTPQERIGDVIGDLNSRRCQVQGLDSHGNVQVVSADYGVRVDITAAAASLLRGGDRRAK